MLCLLFGFLRKCHMILENQTYRTKIEIILLLVMDTSIFAEWNVASSPGLLFRVRNETNGRTHEK